jgi:hypothetical protein
MDKWVPLIFGVYLVFYGLTTESLIDESEGVASEEERLNAKATPLKRALVVGAGIASCVYSVVRFLH